MLAFSVTSFYHHACRFDGGDILEESSAVEGKLRRTEVAILSLDNLVLLILSCLFSCGKRSFVTNPDFLGAHLSICSQLLANY